MSDCEHKYEWHSHETARLRGNNFDIVTSQFDGYCVYCGDHTQTTDIKRVYRDTYKDIDEQRHGSPSRFGT